jgi:hypothetical protein
MVKSQGLPKVFQYLKMSMQFVVDQAIAFVLSQMEENNAKYNIVIQMDFVGG